MMRKETIGRRVAHVQATLSLPKIRFGKLACGLRTERLARMLPRSLGYIRLRSIVQFAENVGAM